MDKNWKIRKEGLEEVLNLSIVDFLFYQILFVQLCKMCRVY